MRQLCDTINVSRLDISARNSPSERRRAISDVAVWYSGVCQRSGRHGQSSSSTPKCVGARPSNRSLSCLAFQTRTRSRGSESRLLDTRSSGSSDDERGTGTPEVRSFSFFLFNYIYPTRGQPRSVARQRRRRR
jgi:hypothetical protein